MKQGFMTHSRLQSDWGNGWIIHQRPLPGHLFYGSHHRKQKGTWAVDAEKLMLSGENS
jgi:hypothetical protein